MSYSYLLAVTYNAVVNIGMQIAVQVPAFASFEYMPRVMWECCITFGEDLDFGL